MTTPSAPTTRFRYVGPLTGITVGDQELMLYPNEEIALPADDPRIALLIAQRRLVPIGPLAAAAAPVPTTAELADRMQELETEIQARTALDHATPTTSSTEIK